MSEWRPIETAPKNGKILLCDRFGDVEIGQWFDRLKQWTGDEYEIQDPTHWTPLPEPPKQTGAD